MDQPTDKTLYIKYLEDENKKLRDENNRLRNNNGEHILKLNDMNDIIERIRLLEKENFELRNENRELKKINEDLTKKISNLETNIKKITEESSKKINNIEENIKAMAEKYTFLEKKENDRLERAILGNIAIQFERAIIKITIKDINFENEHDYNIRSFSQMWDLAKQYKEINSKYSDLCKFLNYRDKKYREVFDYLKDLRLNDAHPTESTKETTYDKERNKSACRDLTANVLPWING